MFVYCNYWQTWSRIIATYGSLTVELNLTPVNPSQASWEDQVKGGRLRTHRTKRHEDDIETDRLPSVIISNMVHHLGINETNYLLFNDYLEDFTILDIIAHSKDDRLGLGIVVSTITRHGKTLPSLAINNPNLEYAAISANDEHGYGVYSWHATDREAMHNAYCIKGIWLSVDRDDDGDIVTPPLARSMVMEYLDGTD